MKKTEQVNSKRNTLSRIVERYKEEVLDHIPYRVNLVWILGANENAHTEILSEILRYKRGNFYPFLQSFLEMVLQSQEFENVRVSKPCIDVQSDYIDALIWEEDKYAIIIENKINWAKDQWRQLENYLKTVQNDYRVPSTKIGLVYLTADGRKKVEDYSLTKEAKRLLGYKGEDNSGRYIEINYKEHILPWLKEKVIFDCRYGEQTLLSMLQQYIDYLEDRFSITDERRKKAVCTFLRKELASYSLEKQAQYDKLNEWLDEDVHGDDEARFIQDVRVFQYQMLEECYSLDWRSAIDAEIEAIRNWAVENGFVKPYKYSDKDGVCAGFQFWQNESRIVFEVAFLYPNNVMSVALYNLDYKKHRIPIKKYKRLYGKFIDCFQEGGALEEDEGCVGRSLGTLN